MAPRGAAVTRSLRRSVGRKRAPQGARVRRRPAAEPGVLDMTLRPLSSFADFELAAAWLQRKENYQWLDFGSSRQGVTPALLKIMVQRQTNFIRLYTSDADDTPIGIVALTNVDRNMRTGTFWIVAGDKSFRSRGWGRVAARRCRCERRLYAHWRGSAVLVRLCGLLERVRIRRAGEGA